MGKDCHLDNPRWVHGLLLLVGIALLLGINSALFVFASPIDRADPARFLAGACLIFLIPGLIGGELLGLRGRSPLETIALSFVVSLALEIGLIAVVLFLGASIQVWVSLLLAVTALGCLTLALTVARGKQFKFLTGLISLPRGAPTERAFYLLSMLAPFLLGALAYCWSEDMADVGGEKYIHATFVRYYAEMPLVLANLGIDRGLPPPNLVHLWEFLLAGWSACVRIDPLPVFAHARMVIPVLGLAGMYLLIRMVFLDWRKSVLVFAGVFILCAGQVMLKSTCLSWVIATDPTRGVFAFFGTAHHADSAADVLLALTAGMFVFFLRQPRPAHAVLLAAVLAASFLWHAREFLQAALYLGVLGPTVLLLPSLRRRVVIGRWLAAAGILVGVAAAAAGVSRLCVPPASHGYDELALKKTAIAYALQPGEIVTVRSLFNYPLFLSLSNPNAPEHIRTRDEFDADLRGQWNYERWLFMAAVATIALMLLGGARDRRLACYHLLLWLLAYCWNFSMLLILALTYSEFFMSTPRLLYLFSYLVIADAALVTSAALYRLCGRMIRVCITVPLVRNAGAIAITAVTLALARRGFDASIRPGHPSAAWLAAALDWSCLPLLLVVSLSERSGWSAVPATRRALPMVLSLALMFVALMPWRGANWSTLLCQAWSSVAAPTDWFGSDNPSGYSKELITWARALPAGHRIATNPLHVAMLSAYTPQYLCVQPVGSVIVDKPERERAARGEHPFYRPAALPGGANPWQVDHDTAVSWLRQRHADYVVINLDDYNAPVLSYFRAHGEIYELVFENSAAQEAVFRVHQPRLYSGAMDTR